jgi:hypothetical protein
MNTERLNRQQRRAARAAGKWVPLRPATRLPRDPQQIEAAIQHASEIAPSVDPARLRAIVEQAGDEIAETWQNDRYLVHVIPWPGIKINDRTVPVVQLSIRRLDRGPCRDWRDFQRIKNQLVGDEAEAIELYPAESRLVDTATQFHLWWVADPLFRFPFGYDSGRVVSGKSVGGSVQRPLDDDEAAA